MQPAGIAAYAKRKSEKSGIYNHENETKKFDPGLQQMFEQRSAAWTYFGTQPPSYRKLMIHWVQSAKQQATRLSRLEKLIDASERGQRVL